MSNLLIKSQNLNEIKALFQKNLKVQMSGLEVQSDLPVAVVVGEDLSRKNISLKYPGNLGGGGIYQNEPSVPILEFTEDGNVVFAGEIEFDGAVFTDQVKIENSGIATIDSSALLHIQSEEAMVLTESIGPSPAMNVLSTDGNRVISTGYVTPSTGYHRDVFVPYDQLDLVTMNFGIGENPGPFDIPGQPGVLPIPSSPLLQVTLAKNNSFVELDLNDNPLTGARYVATNTIVSQNLHASMLSFNEAGDFVSVDAPRFILGSYQDFPNIDPPGTAGIGNGGRLWSNSGNIHYTIQDGTDYVLNTVNPVTETVTTKRLIYSDMILHTSSLQKNNVTLNNTIQTLANYNTEIIGLSGFNRIAGTFTAPSTGLYNLVYKFYLITGNGMDIYQRFKTSLGRSLSGCADCENTLITDQTAFGGIVHPSLVVLEAGTVVSLEITAKTTVLGNIVFEVTRVIG